jgi:hypothetical protein
LDFIWHAKVADPLLGDVNGGPSNAFITSIKDSIEFIIHGGDEGYADDSFLHFGCYVEFCYESAWNNYMNGIIPLGA